MSNAENLAGAPSPTPAGAQQPTTERLVDQIMPGPHLWARGATPQPPVPPPPSTPTVEHSGLLITDTGLLQHLGVSLANASTDKDVEADGEHTMRSARDVLVLAQPNLKLGFAAVRWAVAEVVGRTPEAAFVEAEPLPGARLALSILTYSCGPSPCAVGVRVRWRAKGPVLRG
jgi:hypothetical protein